MPLKDDELPKLPKKDLSFLKRKPRMKEASEIKHIFDRDSNKLNPFTEADVNSEPKQSQIEANSEPKQSQIEHPISEFGARIGARSKPIRSQIEANSEPNFSDLANLSRLQFRCLETIYESCRFTGSRVSERIFSGALADKTKSTQGATKKALQRLEKASLILRNSFKKGPGGWTRYCLPEAVYKELSIREIRANSEPKQSQFGAKTEPGSEPGSEPKATSSSSYILNNKLTTTTAKPPTPLEEDELPPEWRALDFSLLQEMNLHIGDTAKRSFWRAGLDSNAVQQSVYHFAYALQYTDLRERIKTDPLNFFIGAVLGNGAFAAPQGYAAHRRRTIEAVLAQKSEDDR